MVLPFADVLLASEASTIVAVDTQIGLLDHIGPQDSGGTQMISALGAVIVMLGTGIAYMAGRYRHQDVIETIGGVLLITGFALIGYALQCVVGIP